MKYPIKTSFLTPRTGRRPGIAIPGGKPRFIVLHDTGNPNSTAANNVGYYSRSLSMQAGAQVFIDDKEIIECIPVRNDKPEKAWHVMYNTDRRLLGLGAANDYAIGLKLCFFPGNKQKSMEAYKKYIWYAAYMIHFFGMNINNCLIGHEQLDPWNKIDPSHGIKSVNKKYNQLVADIKAEYHSCLGKGSSPVGQDYPKFVRAANSKQIGVVYVKGTDLNVHTEKSLRSKTTGNKLKAGTSWRCYGNDNGMYNVGANQWINGQSKYTHFVPVADKDQVGYATVLGEYLNVRDKASIDNKVSKVIDKVKQDSVHKVYENKNGMHRVGEDRWISAHPYYTFYNGF